MAGSKAGAPGPLYEMVKQHVLKKVEQREWVSNTKLPSEEELAEELQVSRMTVHRALRELTSGGLLLRVPGVGTFISGETPKSISLELRDISGEITAAGGKHSAQVILLEGKNATGELVKELEIKEGSLTFHSLIVHRDNNIAVQLEERFVLPRYAPEYLEQDYTKATTFSYLWHHSHPTRMQHFVYAVLPTKRICQLLQIDANEPCILLTRRTWVSETVATFSRFYYPGSRYRLTDMHELL
ncbi:MAG: UTRA domain-containing protein [Hyphomicrobiales bacterium]|nr:UTRA domain-containing protein [Hyphomicrobiales bacterium]